MRNEPLALVIRPFANADLPAAAVERDDFSSSRHPALPLCLSMIFSENR
jgi:hypothetical protein